MSRTKPRTEMFLDADGTLKETGQVSRCPADCSRWWARQLVLLTTVPCSAIQQQCNLLVGHRIGVHSQTDRQHWSHNFNKTLLHYLQYTTADSGSLDQNI